MTTISLRPQGIQTSLQSLVEECTKSYTNSTCFMKQITAVAVSTIAYVRNICSEESYNTEYFHELKVNILKSRCNDDYAQNLSDVIHSSFEAIDKKYLDTLALVFHVGDLIPENIIESFRFQYAYSKIGHQITIFTMNKSGSEEIKEIDVKTIKMSTMSLLRYCQRKLTAPMPDVFNLSVKLYYKPDVPKGYQAQGFKPGPSIFDHEGEHTHIEQIKTPFHTLAMKCWVNDAANISCNAEPSNSVAYLSMEPESQIPSIKCNCRASKSDMQFGRKLEIIQCTYCKNWQHAICYGYLDASSLTAHCCYQCSCDHAERKPTDPLMNESKENDTLCRQNMCATRRTLEWCCTRTEEITVKYIMEYWSITEIEAVKLINQLKLIGIIKQSNNKESFTNQTKYKIVREILDKTMSNLFYDYDESNYSLTMSANTPERASSPIIPCAGENTFKKPLPKTSYELNNCSLTKTNEDIYLFDDEKNTTDQSTTHTIPKMIHQMSSHIAPRKRYNINHLNSILKRKK